MTLRSKGRCCTAEPRSRPVLVTVFPGMSVSFVYLPKDFIRSLLLLCSRWVHCTWGASALLCAQGLEIPAHQGQSQRAGGARAQGFPLAAFLPELGPESVTGGHVHTARAGSPLLPLCCAGLWGSRPLSDPNAPVSEPLHPTREACSLCKWCLWK